MALWQLEQLTKLASKTWLVPVRLLLNSAGGGDGGSEDKSGGDDENGSDESGSDEGGGDEGGGDEGGGGDYSFNPGIDFTAPPGA